MAKKIFSIEQIIITIIAILVVYGIISISLNFSFLASMGDTEDDFSITDVFYKIENSANHKELNDEIWLIDVTDIYDRGELAEIIDSVCSCSPSVVGLDIIFEGIKDDTLANRKLTDVIEKNDNIVCGFKLTEYNQETDEFQSAVLPFFGNDSTKVLGYANLTTSSNSDVTRMFSYYRTFNGQIVYSLPNVIAHRAVKTIPDEKSDRFIDYAAEEFQVLLPSDLQAFKEELRGKIVMIGAPNEEQDMHFSPIGKISGLHILAYSILTCLHNKDKRDLPEICQLLVVFLIIWITHVIIFLSEYFCDNNSTLKYWKDNIVVVIIFVLIALILFVDYYLYVKQCVYMDIAPCIIGIGVVDYVKKLYAAVINTLTNILHVKLLKKSIYYDI